MKKGFLLFMLVIACCGAGKLVHFVKKGFSVRRIASSAGHRLQMQSCEIDSLLQQPFRYLGRGRQCFAFETLNGQYILKFPRTDIYQTPFWARAFPISNRKRGQMQEMRKKREEFVVNSMQIAYEKLREETGVIAIHFGQTEDLGQTLTLIDPLGIRYQIPAHTTAFVLQLKKPVLMQAFVKALQEGKRRKGENILDAFIDLVVARGKKGIWNKDGSFLRNYGFDGIKGYQIDIGSFYYKNSDKIGSIRDTMSPVQSWLAETDS
ncbi:MAG TPA: hypothetical protein VLE95_06195, partial [Chlamydiales bacterium]|nr:hypothetical protein [Chlamydiales bacterium]